MTLTRTVRILALSFALAVSACASGTLPNTTIPETEETRAVFDRVQQYRTAMEARDVDGVISMVSPRYYENSGTTDSDRDDYGFQVLHDKVLKLLRDNVLSVQYQVLLRNIKVDGDMAVADYEYFYKFKFVEGGNEGWAQRNDFNRLTFAREGGQWMIVGGL
ncbi:MAG: hypothetical protein CL940_09555 [Deltaproteobacteria bacterium]|nr:hypothetical protein [Deltaproteobacteria bacterium]|tara:strand:- start:79 stop:564 length:486 start_codon:yes stop_codon:yes gene_type:complete